MRAEVKNRGFKAGDSGVSINGSGTIKCMVPNTVSIAAGAQDTPEAAVREILAALGWTAEQETAYQEQAVLATGIPAVAAAEGMAGPAAAAAAAAATAASARARLPVPAAATNFANVHFGGGGGVPLLPGPPFSHPRSYFASQSGSGYRACYGQAVYAARPPPRRPPRPPPFGRPRPRTAACVRGRGRRRHRARPCARARQEGGDKGRKGGDGRGLLGEYDASAGERE